MLYTEGDSVLKMSDMDNFSDFLCADRIDGHDADYDSMLVEKEIGHSAWAPSCHDVLLAPSQRRQNEALHVIESWTKTHF